MIDNGKIKTGADAYVTKPNNLRNLESLIGDLIESKEKWLFPKIGGQVSVSPMRD
jgi:hypothetical protein